MDLTKRYTDCFALDKKVNILHMVKHHPEWAANRIQVGERALAMLSPEQRRAAEQGEAQNNSAGVDAVVAPPTEQSTPCLHKFVIFKTDVRCVECGAVYDRYVG